ncbi:hypothetical protein A9Q84_01055 [Halobacteriovorax marinus]|uniref:Radical SAM core domain-containing protein n=1 Tax=Halobacteriovorax marinus TaxID=97084 RepID=A0A1Y5FC91_9BACT|nr:hypothetical protein A9Q84_01055 [Halobacteriovorax marinus]
MILSILCLPLFGKRVCPLAFSKIEISGKGDFIPCCGDWLTSDYFKIEKSDDNLWNGEQAVKLRASMYAGNLSYCKTDICQTTLLSPFILSLLYFLGLLRYIFPQTSFNSKNLWKMNFKKTLMPAPPSMAVLQGDFRCNIACPSCRSTLITTNKPEDEERLARAQHLLDQNARGLSKIQLAGDGEAFFTKWHREQFKNFTKENFPKLKEIILYTNGLLVNEKSFNDLRPGTDFVKNIIISIDAGDSETYKLVRGGDFNLLLKNLYWMKSLRESGRIHTFRICFVVRFENLHSVISFVELGRKLGVDQTIFRPFNSWDNMGVVSYKEQAVHLSDHPRHGEFLEIKNQVKSLPRVVFEA